MKRSDHGHIIFDKMPTREIGEGFRGYIGCKNKSDSPIGGIVLPEHVKSSFDLTKSKPRDLLLYRQTDLLQNIMLENTKDKR